jgi:ADP-heptose:LPS heptosyltransferase
MKPSHYRDKIITLQEGACDRHALSQLAKQIAGSFMDHYYQDGHYDAGYIDLICEMATFFQDKELSRAVSSAFFSVIIEELCDDYEDFQFEAYSKVMSQVISYCRRIPAGEKIERYLNRFKLFCAEDIVNRAGRIHTRKYRFEAKTKAVKQIYLLSRITVGADVAIVSVMIQRLSILFPDAQITLLGSLKLNEIFGGNSRLRIRHAAYVRGGGLLERLESWCDVVDMMDEETAADEGQGVLVLDPDSRMTQLGVLPICEEENYLYFNSHNDLPSAGNPCMAELTNAWMDSVFGRAEFCYPAVWVDAGVLDCAGNLTNSLRQSGCRRITAVNFGVGGNPRKRLGLEFEKKLICELLKEPQSVVILDEGFGPEELANSQAIIEAVKSAGYAVGRVPFNHSSIENFSHGLLTAECTIGQIAALIGSSDEFIGYDSACQHIAAALAVGPVTVFVGSNNPHFIRRWSACGNTSCKVVHVDTQGHADNVSPDEIVGRIIDELPRKTRKAGSRIKIVSYKDAQSKSVKDKLEGRTV